MRFPRKNFQVELSKVQPDKEVMNIAMHNLSCANFSSEKDKASARLAPTKVREQIKIAYFFTQANFHKISAPLSGEIESACGELCTKEAKHQLMFALLRPDIYE